MKLLLFAHTPPPHHGQSYMVKLMLEGFGGDQRRPGAAAETPVACYHVNARFSDGMDDIGKMRGGKGLRLLRYCAEALWCRFRYGVRTLYHIPAPGKRSALYRDWVLLLLCRPFFPHRVMHWHAVGLEAWLKREGYWWERAISRRLYADADLGITLTEAFEPEAAAFRSRKIVKVPNGIPDLCPDYAHRIRPLREKRARERLTHRSRSEASPLLYRALFLGHCTREKGVFDLLEAVALVNSDPASRLRVVVTMAGSFVSNREEAAIRERMARPDLAGAIHYIGFIGPEEKIRLLEEVDCLLFPSHWESFGLVVLEAMACGAAVLTTRCCALPELLPEDYPGLVPVGLPGAIAEALLRLAALDPADSLRARFEAHFTMTRYLDRLRAALLSVDAP